MLEVSYLAAFFGGVLTLLSPCSALLLPAFFAYAFGGAGELVKKTGFFYLGLAATLVPLGMGISAVSRLVYGQRSTLILLSGILIITLGVLQLAGRGFSVGPLARLSGKVRGDSVGGVFALGAVYGFAGFCSGPILGAVLTVAASSGHVAQGAGLLAVYALGMAVPLFLMATLWDRLDLGRRRWLRGRDFSLGPLQIHTTNFVSGLMFVALGAVFITYEGTSALSGLYEENGAVDLAYAAESWVSSVSRIVPDYLLLVVLAVAVAALALARWGAYFRNRDVVPDRGSRDGEERST